MLYRKTKEEASTTIESCFASPASESHSKDPLWTPGQWLERESGNSSDDDFSAEKDRNVLQVYNEAISSIASLTDTTVALLTFRLASDWDLATANERALCLDQVDEACRAVCSVIAPRDSEKLRQEFQESASGNLKTQILSLYASRYSVRFLKKMHEPFEILSDRQIKKARAHAKNVGVGFNVEKLPSHRVRIDLVKLDHFLSFVDQPYFYQ